MKSLFLALAACVATIALLTMFMLQNKTEKEETQDTSPTKNTIRERHTAYMQSFKDYDPDTSYSFLTPYSQKKVSLQEWEKKVLKSSQQQEEKINAVILRDNETRAIIGIKATDGNAASNYTQTWKLVGGEWLRAYFEDSEPKPDNAVSSSNETEDHKETNPFPDELPFSIEEFSYEWELDRGIFSRSELYRPEVTLRIRNSSWDNHIEYLQIRVQFVKGFTEEIFSSEYTYVISSSDIPLAPNSLSEKIFLKSNIGLNIKTFLNLSKLDDKYANKYLNKLAEHISNIEPILYYKLDHSSEWKKIEEYIYR